VNRWERNGRRLSIPGKCWRWLVIPHERIIDDLFCIDWILLIKQILEADLYSGRCHRLRRASTSSAMANELVKPGLSMPNKFMNPGYPSSIRITKSWSPPAPVWVSVSAMFQGEMIPDACVIACEALSFYRGEILTYSLVYLIEMRIIDFIILRIRNPFNVRTKSYSS
jgi:hypothetical protein